MRTTLSAKDVKRYDVEFLYGKYHAEKSRLYNTLYDEYRDKFVGRIKANYTVNRKTVFDEYGFSDYETSRSKVTIEVPDSLNIPEKARSALLNVEVDTLDEASIQARNILHGFGFYVRIDDCPFSSWSMFSPIFRSLGMSVMKSYGRCPSFSDVPGVQIGSTGNQDFLTWVHENYPRHTYAGVKRLVTNLPFWKLYDCERIDKSGARNRRSKNRVTLSKIAAEFNSGVDVEDLNDSVFLHDSHQKTWFD